MKKLLTILFTFYSLLSIGQSETHDFTTYDTLIGTYDGTAWRARISRPVDYFTPNHPDTTSRPLIITMPGAGQVGTNYSYLQLYGPHYWLNNGWDGGVVLSNGTHYPLLITVMPGAVNPRVGSFIKMLQALFTKFHPKSDSRHFAGLSMGAFTIAGMINGQLTGGGEEGMQLANSITLLQGDGQGATAGIMGTATPYHATNYSAFGHWASKYGGKFFGLEGTADTRNVWNPRDNIQDSVGTGSAYFAYETYGGGSHCCWNSMYDPNAKNWKCTQGDLGTNIAWNTNHNNSMGSYVNGWSIFEWMLRQGDTTLVGTGNVPPSVNAGSDQNITLPTDSVYINATTSDADGSISTQSWVKISGPASYTISTPSGEDTWIKDLTEGVYVFRLTSTDDGGASSSDDVTITVNPDQTEYPSPSGKKIVGNGEYQNLFIDKNGYLWGGGNIGNIGTNNTGTAGIVYRVSITPSDLKFKMAAGALHGSAAVDTAGYVWVVGDNDQYQHGIGNNTHPIYTPSKITVDSAGDPFNNVRTVVGYFVKDGGNGYNGFFAIKNDSTLWGWGTMIKGMRGDSTAGDIKSRPVQIDVDGKKVVQIIAGQFAMALCSDGTVYTWGEGASSNNLGYSGTTADKWAPHQLTGLSNIRMIAGGLNWNFAINNTNVLYGWGAYGERLGFANGLPISTPTVLNNIMNGLPLPIKSIVTNSAATHAILTDSTLWGWGDNGQGTVGNGEKINFHIDGGNPFDRNNLDVVLPVQIAPGILFDTVFGGSTYTYHTYARDIYDSLYCWGRGKSSVLANWLRSASSNITATYGNSWDIAWPTPVDPFNITTSYIQTSDYCVKVDGTQSPCNQYSPPANTAPVANAGANQSLSDVTETTLDGSASSDNVFISRYEWRQLTGPTTAVIDLPASKTPTVRNLSDGTYTFELLAEDNGWFTDLDTVQIIINQASNQLPVITSVTSTADTIHLPTSSVKVTVMGTDADGTVDEYAWTLSSGPGGSGPTFNTPLLDTCTISNFTIAGTYVVQIKITDNDGGEAYQTIPIVVLPASSTGAAMKYKVNVYNGTNGVFTDNWNNWNAVGGSSINNIIDTTGAESNVSVSVSVGSIVTNSLVPSSSITGFPDSSLLHSSFTTSTRNLIISGVENSALYTLELVPCRYSTNANTCVTYGGITKCVNAYQNTDSSIIHTDLQPVNGELPFSMYGTTANYISAFILTRQGEETPINASPTANAGSDQLIILPRNFVTLNGSSSTDSDGSLVSYKWELLTSDYPITFSDSSAVSTQVSGLPVGTHQFGLTVTDDQGATGFDTVTITVLPEIFRRFFKGRRILWKSN